MSLQAENKTAIKQIELPWLITSKDTWNPEKSKVMLNIAYDTITSGMVKL
jgi:hypothetical protein